MATACGSGSGRQGTEIVVTGTGPTGSVQGGSNAVFEGQVRITADKVNTPKSMGR